MSFEIIHEQEKQVKESIKFCQKEGHVQQVCFSTYHHAYMHGEREFIKHFFSLTEEELK